jgi:phosphogluconate dehydratase
VNPQPLHPVLAEVTARIEARSADTRAAYLQRVAAAVSDRPRRRRLSCGNLAHGYAACGGDKPALMAEVAPNLGIVTAYNDMLSAHQPFETFPALIKEAARAAGGTAQVAGGVPAMCDGVTQGRPGMELSLFSREVIAMSTGIALSHDLFDSAVFLGVCDKIVPGLLMGALAFGHLPAVFIPAGPMESGLSNDDKRKNRQLYAEGKIDRAALLASESKAYHGPGTCTFYGTANSNQMLMEIMGLHTPGSSFVNPGTPLRDALTAEATRRALAITALGSEFTPVSQIVDAKAIVNGMAGLMATGGSTNHALHIVAIARAAGFTVDWNDLSDVSSVVPLLARVYPNGSADVNHFAAAGGMGFLIGTLLDHGLLHGDVSTVWGKGLDRYRVELALEDGQLVRRAAPAESYDPAVLRPASDPFQATGGLKLLSGNLGRSVIKTSAVDPKRHIVEAPARVFGSQQELASAFKAGTLTGDFVAVVRFQGPRANGMPELHRLTPLLSVLQDRGQKVALVTDGRMSGASGKIPAAIHLSPESLLGGPIGKVRDGDIIRLDAVAGTLEAKVPAEEWAARPQADRTVSDSDYGTGRELFAMFRQLAAPAEWGGGTLFVDPTPETSP